MALLLFCASLLVLLLAGPERTKYADRFSSGHDPKMERALTAEITSHGGQSCTSETESRSRTATYVASTRAVAAIACDAIGTGPSRITALHFEDAASLDAYELDNHHFVNDISFGGACATSNGETPWTTTKGLLGGRLYCETSGDTVGIAWTDRAKLDAFYASSSTSTIPTLLSWWLQYVKGVKQVDPGGLSAIRTRFGGAVTGGLKGCTLRTNPIADAEMDCTRTVPASDQKSYVSSLAIFHFPNAVALDAFFKNYAAVLRAPSTRSSGFCDTRVLVSSTFDDDNHVAGRVFCFPAADAEWLLWTMDDHNMAALISRADQNLKGIYAAWQGLPG